MPRKRIFPNQLIGQLLERESATYDLQFSLAPLKCKKDLAIPLEVL